jgi:hypothetical protein
MSVHSIHFNALSQRKPKPRLRGIACTSTMVVLPVSLPLTNIWRVWMQSGGRLSKFYLSALC